MGEVFFFNDTATTELYTLSLHDALPICVHFGRLVAVANQGFDFPQIRVQLPQFGIERVDFVGQDIGVDVERCEAIEC